MTTAQPLLEMSVSQAILLVYLAVYQGLVSAQINKPQLAPPFQGASLGNCDTIQLSELPDLIASQLQAEAERQNPNVGMVSGVTVHQMKITCLAFGTEAGKYSSVAVATQYSCGGEPCSVPSSTRALAHFSFKCGPDDNLWTIYGETEPEFNTANHLPSFATVEGSSVSPPGSCTSCYNVAMASIGRPGVRNVLTQCLGELMVANF